MKIYTDDLKMLEGKDRTISIIEDFLIQQPGVKIDLGCGKTKPIGYIGIDRFSHSKVDITLDLDHSVIPMEENSVSVVRAVHVVEHINNVVPFWNEIFRICKPGAFVYVVVPHPMGPWYQQDPTHKSVYSEKTFLKYFDGKFVESYSDYGFRGSMHPVSVFIHGKVFNKLAVHAVMEVQI